MRYKKLGHTDIDVSLICLGTMTWGEQNTEADGHEQMDYAVDQGINFFDTAEMYSVPVRPETQGSTERIIGSWFEKTGKRKDIILASKIAGPSAFSTHVRTDKDYSKRTIDEAISGSLKRLKTDYIDVYQLHWPARRTNFFGQRSYRHKEGWEDNFLEILEAMDDQIKRGRIRYFGISNETPWGLMQFLNLAEKHGLPRCVSVQNPYSLVNRLYEVGLSEMSVRTQVGLLAYSPLAFGLLSGKFHDGRGDDNCRFIKYRKALPRYTGENTFKAVGKYAEIAKKHDLTPAHMALAYVNNQPFVTSNIIGATSMEQLKENISSVDVTLSKECIQDINAIHESIPNPAP